MRRLGRLDILVNNAALRRGHRRCNARTLSIVSRRSTSPCEYPGGIAHHERRRPHHLYVVRRRDPRRLAWLGRLRLDQGRSRRLQQGGAARDLGPKGITVKVVEVGSANTDMNSANSP
jgi:NAD(P)-dependent dehydrogenase (short-subunit alcohol dehydrogenase family)